MADEPTDDTTEAGDAATEGAATDDAVPGDAAADDAASADTEAQPAVEPGPTTEAKGERDRPGVFIPRGVAILLGVLVLIGLVGGGGFALGRGTAGDDHGDGHSVFVPFRPGERMGPQSRNGNGGTQIPLPREVQPVPSGGAFLGVQIDTATGATTGAQVVRVTSGSPADKAGLAAGDVITKVDGDDIANAQALFTAISGHASGDTVTITYVRNGDTKTTDVTLASRPSSNSNTAPAVPS